MQALEELRVIKEEVRRNPPNNDLPMPNTNTNGNAHLANDNHHLTNGTGHLTDGNPHMMSWITGLPNVHELEDDV